MKNVAKLYIWFVGAEKRETYKIEKRDGFDVCSDLVTDGMNEGWLDFSDINGFRVVINMDDISQISYEEEYEEEEETEEEN